MGEPIKLAFVKFVQGCAVRDPDSKGTSGYNLEYFEYDRNDVTRLVRSIEKIDDMVVIRSIATGKTTRAPWAAVQSSTDAPKRKVEPDASPKSETRVRP